MYLQTSILEIFDLKLFRGEVEHSVEKGGHLGPLVYLAPALDLHITLCVTKILLLFRLSVLHDSLQPLNCSRLPYPSLSLWACSNLCPLSQWSHPTISSSVVPFLLPSLSQDQGLFQWVGSMVVKGLELQLQYQFFQWVVRVDFL